MFGEQDSTIRLLTTPSMFVYASITNSLFNEKKKSEFQENQQYDKEDGLLTSGVVCEPDTLLGIPLPLYWYREEANQLLLCSAQEPNASDMLQRLSTLKQHSRRHVNTEAAAHKEHHDFNPPAALPSGHPFSTNQCRQQHRCHRQLLNSA